MSLSITKILTKNIIRKTLCEGEEEEEAESISSSLTPRSSMDTSLSIQIVLVVSNQESKIF